MKAIRIHAYGGPEVLRYEDAPAPEPRAGEAVVRVAAAGLNYIDTYHRTGLYKLGAFPLTPGVEAAGTVTAVADDVSFVRIGEAVAFAGPIGAYAERVAVPAERLVPIPPGLEAETAAAAMLQGLTAHYLTHSTYPLRHGETCLVHAAAGGVGLLLRQIARRRGARVIGTVSTEAKARLAREAGAEAVILYTTSDFVAETRRLTEGRGVQVVYDGVGRDTFEGSLACLAPRGMLALFGQASGSVGPFDPGLLAQKGSLFLTRPTLYHYVASREELLARAGDVLGWVAAGHLRLRIEKTYPLAEAAEAHRALEGRQTSGKVLLIP
jgi:NADPH:quinone reductase